MFKVKMLGCDMGQVGSGSEVPQPDPRGFGLTKTQAQPNPQPARVAKMPRWATTRSNLGNT